MFNLSNFFLNRILAIAEILIKYLALRWKVVIHLNITKEGFFLYYSNKTFAQFY